MVTTIFRKNKIFVKSFILSLLLFSLCSCEKEVIETDTDDSNYLLLVDSEDETPYQLALINADKRSVCFMNLDENCHINNMDYLYNEGESMLNVSFDDNGLIKKIRNEKYSVLFSNHNGYKVDLAFMVNDQMLIAKEVDLGLDWDNYIYNDNLTSRSLTRVGFGKGFDDFADRVKNSRFHRELYDKNSAVSFVIGQIRDIKNVVQTGIIEGAEASLREVKEWMKDLVIDGVIDVGFKQEELANYLTVLDYTDKIADYGSAHVADMIEYNRHMHSHSKKLRISTWDVALDLLGEYDKITDWFADQWLKFFEWQDRREQEERLAQAALASGYGALKVTLTWNFYADIDLQVKEPDGNLIYWKNMKSNSGGYLDVDNRKGGNGASENVFWKEPKDGRYRIYLNYYGASTYNNLKMAGYCMVLVMYHGVGKEFRVDMTEGNLKEVVEIDVPSGEFISTRSYKDPMIDIQEINKNLLK